MPTDLNNVEVGSPSVQSSRTIDSESESHTSSKMDATNSIEPYALNPTVSENSNSITRTKSNLSEISRIITAIKDDHQQDIEEFPEYRERGDPDSILVSQLALVSKHATYDQEQNINTETNIIERIDTTKEIDTRVEVEEEEDLPPDGGFGWIIAICAMLAMFSTWGANAGYGVFLNYYLSTNEFEGATKFDYALIGGIVVFLAQILAPFSALACKIFGIRVVGFVGIALQTLGYILASFATNIWHLYLTQGFLIGLSFVMIYLPATLVLPTWFHKRRATAMGIAVAGAGLGGLTFSLSVDKIIHETGDQRWALRMCGFVTMTTALIAVVIMKPRNYKPLPYSTTLKSKFIKENFKIICDIKIFKIYPLALLSLWYSLALLGYTLMLFSIASYARSVGLSATDGSHLTAFLNAGQVLGRPLVGMTADKIGRNNMSTLISLIIAILLWGFWINATTFGSLTAFSVILGCIIGVGSSMGQPLAADIIDSPEQLPAAWSGLNIVVSFFCLVAEVIALGIRDESSDRPFLNTQIFSGTCFFVCFLILLINREWLVRRTLNRRLESSLSRILILERCKNGYLRASDMEKKDKASQEEAELELLQDRVERYTKLLENSISNLFVRMFYPIRV